MINLKNLLALCASVCATACPAADFDWLNVLTSPVVTADSVTFRVSAPSASRVEVKGQFGPGRTALAPIGKGVWQATIAAPAPDIYPYSFVIDGVEVSDPGNPLVFPNEGFKSSILVVPDTAALYTVRDVPHGKIHYDLYKSDVLGEHRNMVVYTPAEYDRNPTKRYPVFYLISGTTDTEEVWYKVGRLNVILDNLIASGEAEPMIVVMPYGYMNNGTPMPTSPETAEMHKVFVREMTECVMPHVEADYRTIPDRDYRAIAGFSRGGGQAMFTALSLPEKFGWLNVYSAFLTPEVTDKCFPDAAADLGKLNSLWFCVGKDDFLYNDVLKNLEYLDKHGVKYESELREGSHTWMHARHCLAHSLRTLFKGGDTGRDGLVIDDTSMPGYTIYRPADMAAATAVHGKLKPFVFGNGGCSHNSSEYLPLLARMAANGYVVMAVGAVNGAFAANLGGRDTAEIGREDRLTDAIDWLTIQNAMPGSVFFDAIDTGSFAVGGHSCGGAQALAASHHPLVKTTLVLNAGMGDMSMAGADSATLATLHAPVLYLIGGPDDIAYSNAELDFERIDKVPVVCMNIPVGHGGTYTHPRGGVFGDIIMQWLDWQLKGNQAAAAAFTANSEHDVKTKNFD